MSTCSDNVPTVPSGGDVHGEVVRGSAKIYLRGYIFFVKKKTHFVWFYAVLKLKTDEKWSLGAKKCIEDKSLVEKWYFDGWFRYGSEVEN